MWKRASALKKFVSTRNPAYESREASKLSRLRDLTARTTFKLDSSKEPIGGDYAPSKAILLQTAISKTDLGIQRHGRECSRSRTFRRSRCQAYIIEQEIHLIFINFKLQFKMRFLSLSSAVAALASLAAAEELTTFSLVINRDGAIFTKVLTSTVGNTDIGYAQQYVTNTNIHVYTVGDAEASSSFWAYVNGATATESSSATSTAEATSSTEASSSEVTSAPESSEATTTSSSAAELTTETVVLYKNNHLFTKVVTNTVGIINPERAAASGNTNVLAYTVGDSSASASFYSALYEKTAAAQSSQASSSPAAVSSQASSSPAAVSSQSSAAASSSADIATYEGAAAQNVAMVGMGALLSGMAVLLM
ncbi:hypothetical protein KL905_004263 [Ogataea polymorpha]|nr:hypothetical protein KL906_003902 [Ogataea polymorpha]KAG7918184.1 hypothetical protein KL905_004263 [Ogataea polymorpha]